ncbi:MAG TPA: hypothetical protein VFI19_14380 [Nocardioides sp.]|nr:hypothetical protein [Nocardioides sp.]
MSTPAPPPADAVPTVPYGGPVSPVDAGTVRAPLTPQTVAKGVGKAALWVGIRAVLFLVVKAILKGIAKR